MVLNNSCLRRVCSRVSRLVKWAFSVRKPSRAILRRETGRRREKILQAAGLAYSRIESVSTPKESPLQADFNQISRGLWIASLANLCMAFGFVRYRLPLDAMTMVSLPAKYGKRRRGRASYEETTTVAPRRWNHFQGGQMRTLRSFKARSSIRQGCG